MNRVETAAMANSPWRRAAWPAATAAVIGLATLALRVRDPHQSGSWGRCPTKLLTGWDCPMCGSLRAVNDLTHLDLTGAASSNLLFVLAVPVLVLAWVWWWRRSWQGRSGPVGIHWRPLLYAAVALGVVFTVVRNLPGSWLAS